jgi:hypothetical protein
MRKHSHNQNVEYIDSTAMDNTEENLSGRIVMHSLIKPVILILGIGFSLTMLGCLPPRVIVEEPPVYSPEPHEPGPPPWAPAMVTEPNINITITPHPTSILMWEEDYIFTFIPVNGKYLCLFHQIFILT